MLNRPAPAKLDPASVARSPAVKSRYDAFISYSHRGERDIARSLERTLWTFGRKWYQIRGIRTYRDETNLAAEPDLWPAIEGAVLHSGCLILLASPDSASSTWVPREIQAFVRAHGIERMCLVQTGGLLPWTDQLSPRELIGNPESALRADLLTMFGAEQTPLVIDIRPFRTMADSNRRRDPEYLSRIAAIAAKVLRQEKEAIWGQFHRAQRLRNAFLGSAATILLGLLIALTWVVQLERQAQRLAEDRSLEAQKQTTIATEQRNRADEARRLAEREQGVAEDRSLEAQKQTDIATDQRDKARQLLYTSQMKLAYEMSQRNYAEGVFGILNSTVPNHGEPDLRGFDWYYLKRLYNSATLSIAQEYSQKKAVPSSRTHFPIQNLTFLPDNRIAINVRDVDGIEGELKLWQLSRTSRPVNVQNIQEYGVPSLAISPDGAFVVGVHSYKPEFGSELMSAVVLDYMNESKRDILVHNSKYISELDYSPQGGLLAISGEAGVQILTFPGTKLVRMCNQPGVEVRALRISSDGRFAAFATGGVLLLCDTQTQEEPRKIDTKLSGITSIAFSSDAARVVTAGEDGRMMLWNVKAGSLTLPLSVSHGQWISATEWSPDGQHIASADTDGVIKLWNAKSGRQEDTLRGHTAGITALAYRRDGGLLASGDSDGNVKLWETSMRLNNTEATIATDVYEATAISPDARLVASSRSGVITVSEVATGRPLFTLDRYERTNDTKVQSLAFSPDGKFLASGGNSEIVDRRLEAKVLLWSLKDRKPVAILRGHQQYVGALAFSPNGQRLVSGSLDAIKMWDVMSGHEVKSLFSIPASSSLLDTSSGGESFLGFSPDGRFLVSSGLYGPIALWDMILGTRKVLCPHTSLDPAISFAPDGRGLAAVNEWRNVVEWNVGSGTSGALLGESKEALVSEDSSSVWSLAFSPDKKVLAAGMGDQEVRVWSVPTGQLLCTLRPNQDVSRKDGDASIVAHVAFTPDSKTLIAVGRDGSLFRWVGALQ